MNRVKIVMFFLIISVLGSCTSFVKFTSDDRVKKIEFVEKEDTESIAGFEENIDYDGNYELTDEVFTGFASYYHNKFHGRNTSSGEPYDKDDYTAAHRTLPFGTRLLVRNLNNNKTVIVRINDRGPFVRGRILDLSRVAAEEIDMLGSGVVEIEATVIKFGN